MGVTRGEVEIPSETKNAQFGAHAPLDLISIFLVGQTAGFECVSFTLARCF